MYYLEYDMYNMELDVDAKSHILQMICETMTPTSKRTIRRKTKIIMQEMILRFFTESTVVNYEGNCKLYI
jgi:hypothetical protein